LAYTTEQLDDAKRSLSALKDKRDELQTLVVQERVAHERLVHELTRQHETESQHRLQTSMQAVEAQVEEIKKSRQFLEKEVEKHLDAVMRLRQENLSLQQASDERLQSLQQELDRQYKELQDKQDQLRDAHKETAKATEKCQQIQRRVEEQDRVMCRLKEGYEERLRELSIAAEAAASHHRATMETKTEVIARLESQLLRADRLLSQQTHAYEERFDGFADAMAAFLQDQVKREHERRQPSQANPTKEAKAPETGPIVYG
jgi:chromosome segregation ATPase